MSSPGKKQQKIGPLIKIRQIQYDQESAVLSQLQLRRQAAIGELQVWQSKYMSSIDQLNKERQSPERKMLEALERSVDLAKSQWYQKLKSLREIEYHEKMQMQQVFEAQKRLRMLEKLDERYEKQDLQHLKKAEQKQLDEFAIINARRKGAE